MVWKQSLQEVYNFHNLFFCSVEQLITCCTSVYIYFFINRTWVLLEKQKTLPYRCTWSMPPVFVESELLIYFCYFVYIILFTLCSLLCCRFSMTGLCPWITFFWFPLESSVGSRDYFCFFTNDITILVLNQRITWHFDHF